MQSYRNHIGHLRELEANESQTDEGAQPQNYQKRSSWNERYPRRQWVQKFDNSYEEMAERAAKKIALRKQIEQMTQVN